MGFGWFFQMGITDIIQHLSPLCLHQLTYVTVNGPEVEVASVTHLGDCDSEPRQLVDHARFDVRDLRFGLPSDQYHDSKEIRNRSINDDAIFRPFIVNLGLIRDYGDAQRPGKPRGQHIDHLN